MNRSGEGLSVGKLLPNGSHTESRMRENCTYGSMRGRAFPTGHPALLYTLLDLF